MTASAPLNVQAIVNLLHRRQPAALEQLRQQYASHAAVLSPGKILGEQDPPRQLLMDLARSTFTLAKEQGRAVADRLRKRLRMSARLKLAGSIVSSLSTAGIVAAAWQGRSAGALVAGVVAFVAAVATLVAQYIDDFAGAGSSPRELLQQVDAALLEVFQAEGEFQLMAATGLTQPLEDLVRKLNVSVALFRQAELRFG